ncbi:MAG TPA: hypothetical protein DC049_11365 [Spirochaetia bacterium]|nr:hypothetical protein [Spirochaetia bacterium]
MWEELDARARVIRGSSPKRIPEIETCDGLILLGYHAMAGTPEAVLEHTMDSRHWQNFWINGEKAGEVAIDAAIAGNYRVPVIMVSGDDKVCAEACKLIKNIITVEVKKGLACEGAILLSMEKAHAVITEGAKKAVKSIGSIMPYQPLSPVTLRLELVSRGIIPREYPQVKIIDGRTYEVTAANVEEALKLL